eukprot:5640711-Heterocapsa_arctica.AAC.1
MGKLAGETRTRAHFELAPVCHFSPCQENMLPEPAGLGVWVSLRIGRVRDQGNTTTATYSG